jgi:hypothetical protein
LHNIFIMSDVIINNNNNNMLREGRYYNGVCLFVSSVKCPLIIVNLNKVMIRNPQQSVGCWLMEKQVTSNITQLSLAESLDK